MNLIFLAINHYHHKIKLINILFFFFSFEGHNTLSMPKYEMSKLQILLNNLKLTRKHKSVDVVFLMICLLLLLIMFSFLGFLSYVRDIYAMYM